MTILEEKIIHYNLNLFYLRNGNIDSETNLLIQKTVNDILNKYENTNKLFVLEYQDDIISAVCYKMLISFLELANIKIVLYGRRRKTKKLINKKQKFISKRKLNELEKENNIVYISVYHPIYQVITNNKKFNHFSKEILYPIKNFTPAHILSARKFYHIGYIQKDLIEHFFIKEFSDWCNTTGENIFTARTYNYFDILIEKEYNIYNEKEIHLLKLTDDLKKNQIILNEVEKLDGLFFYEFPNDVNPYDSQIYNQLMTFSLFIKNNSNTFGYYNWCIDNSSQKVRNRVDIKSIASKLQVKIIIHKYKEE